MRKRVAGMDNAAGKQRVLVELYDKFFATAFPKTVAKLGIVYTPVEIVDFILRSADEVLRAEFGQGLTDEGVHVLDPFTGTGTFLVRLLQSGLIEPHDLARKYANELHANEILLLAYYIAAANIETTYEELATGRRAPEPAVPRPGAHRQLPVLGGRRPAGHRRHPGEQRTAGTAEAAAHPGDRRQPAVLGRAGPRERRQREREVPDAGRRDPRHLRRAVDGDQQESLYDSYIRAIKWATLRIQDRGVVAFVTNGGFLDSNTADGMRQTLAEEFSAIHVFNLRGNQRTAGEQSRREGGKVFGAGSRATVAITVLVKKPDAPVRPRFTTPTSATT